MIAQLVSARAKIIPAIRRIHEPLAAFNMITMSEPHSSTAELLSCRRCSVHLIAGYPLRACSDHNRRKLSTNHALVKQRRTRVGLPNDVVACEIGGVVRGGQTAGAMRVLHD